jgi:uncharacterized protein
VKVTLSLTHDCNLACRYCYAGRKFHADMPVETARRAVDFVLDLPHDGRPLQFNFFGGEPFLRLDLMREVVAYIYTRSAPAGRAVALAVTTNGTLLDDNALAFLLEMGLDLCVSLDGAASVHNRHRVYPDGSGSHADVVRNLRVALAELPSIQVNAVVCPETVDALPETIDFLVDLGAPVIHLNLDITASWDAAARASLGPALQQVADRYIACFSGGRELAVNLIDGKAILFLKGGYGPEDRCGMGDTEWGFAPSGNVYACERFIGQDDDPCFRLGNIHTGVDPRRRCAIAASRGNRNPECFECSVAPYCMNWCGCTNFHMTGSSDLAGPALCAGERAAVAAARRAFVALSENELFVDHLMRYLQQERCHQPRYEEVLSHG